LIFTQNCSVNRPAWGKGVLASGADVADITPENPVAYGPPDNPTGPVTVGKPQPASNLVFGGVTSDIAIFVMLEVELFVPMIR